MHWLTIRPLSLLLALTVAWLVGCAPTATERLGLGPLKTAESVDLSRYVGTWYEMASFPQSFQEGCTGTTATYTKREDGEAVVGHPSRDYLWILSRTAHLDVPTYDGILARLRAQGYEIERLRKTLQPTEGPAKPLS